MNQGGGQVQLAVEADRRHMMAQMLRYLLMGGLVTALGAAVYWTMVTLAGTSPQAANAIAFGVALATGYGVHSRWTFRGHGTREKTAGRTLRFLVTNLIAYGLNVTWVWLLTDALAGPDWSPVVPMLLVTPGVSFILHRLWTFR